MITIEHYTHSTTPPQSGFVARDNGEPIAVSGTFVGVLTKLILRDDAQRRHAAAEGPAIAEDASPSNHNHPG